ncbi:uncharacterized protein LOC128214655 [Mya arenaria]|uniref:uncharacterized protein LOC128214655 n=1 Tax=Mya arenaria TaxID=6604 RepID=UPI0022E8E455|nr:uncharacterized protein LOC128214655 [Mya arenaria]XP_052777185.1 uncharacterized protein LOC128214655 [Mya arenaria]XP_052777186.1 uncharacterized protein LOC128214655 [Mya arenaria]
MLNTSKLLQFVKKNGSGTLNNQNMEAQDIFLPLLKAVKNASSYIERGMSTSIYKIESFFHTISTAMASKVSFITATLDVVLRSPVTVITTLLSLIQNILNGTVYILLDVIHFCMEECLVFAIRAVMYILCSVIANIFTATSMAISLLFTTLVGNITLLDIIQTILNGNVCILLEVILSCIQECLIFAIRAVLYILYSVIVNILSVAISLLFTTLVGYITIVDFVVFTFVFPVCDVLFWILAGLSIVVGLFYLHRKLAQVRGWEPEVIKYLLALPVVCAFTYIWRNECADILSYIVHPLCYIFILVCCTFVTMKLCQLIFHEKLKFMFKETLKGNASKEDPICKECVICFEENVFVTIVPCMHSNICQPCISHIKLDSNRCPMCRGIIQDVQIPLSLLRDRKDVFVYFNKLYYIASCVYFTILASTQPR